MREKDSKAIAEKEDPAETPDLDALVPKEKKAKEAAAEAEEVVVVTEEAPRLGSEEELEVALKTRDQEDHMIKKRNLLHPGIEAKEAVIRMKKEPRKDKTIATEDPEELTKNIHRVRESTKMTEREVVLEEMANTTVKKAELLKEVTVAAVEVEEAEATVASEVEEAESHKRLPRKRIELRSSLYLLEKSSRIL